MKYFFAFFLIFCYPLFSANTIPTDVQLPGTQPNQVQGFTTYDNCDNCHGGTTNPEYEPNFPWRGSMMGNASRDPLFWATLAIVEQDFIPNSNVSLRGGAGDLCLRCHTVNGWVSGRSTPTNGAGMTSQDVGGVECEFCHLLVDPDQPLSISGTTETQFSPFLAYDQATGTGYYGAAQYVINGNGVRLGPYANHTAKHQALPSPFHRKSEMCGTCHDVSNPAVGDLAPGNGAQEPLPSGKYSGILGSPVQQKAAFLNFPYKYGIVERTYSEWKSSSFPNLLVNNFNSLPSELKASHGSIFINYQRAYVARSNANYEDGTQRYFTCQTCHMSASTGVGCNKSGTPTRTDLPRHDLTGSGYWITDAIIYQDTKGTLRFGGGLTTLQKDAMNAAKLRAQDVLKSALSLQANQEGDFLKVKIVNLTGHKLISGYPEGRRMWINIKWYDAGNNLIYENGAYGNIGRTVQDLNGFWHNVKSIINPESTKIYEAKMGITKEWAEKLITQYNYNPNLVISYDRLTDQPEHTLGELANSPPGTSFHSFHFVLNNKVIADNRIPPYGFNYNMAKQTQTLPVPENQFGNPGPGGIYNHWDEVFFQIPNNATQAQVRIYYQPTSWEYIQFLWLANDRQDPFLANEGVNMLDAWLNTGQATPLELRMVVANNLVPPAGSPPGEPSHQNIRAEHMRAKKGNLEQSIDIFYTPGCNSIGHTVYYGPLSNVSSYGYTNSFCSNDTGGYINFIPPTEDIFFLIVSQSQNWESSYGKSSSGTERPEAYGIGLCNKPKNLNNTCDP